MQRRVAVFVDGENVGSAHAAAIRRVAAERGEIRIARVYGNLGKLNGWQDAAQFSVVHAGTGKNATDILLSLDALELALDGRFDTCVVASSDGDFSHLAVKLRERGLRVVGAGHAATPAQFQQKCAEFVVLGAAKTQSAPNGAGAEPKKGERDRQIEALIGQLGDEPGMTIQKLGELMNTRHSTSCADLEEKNWRAYLEKRSSLYVLEGDTVRMKAPGMIA
jgi:uncharacterized protein (TIGR00288 family)